MEMRERLARLGYLKAGTPNASAAPAAAPTPQAGPAKSPARERTVAPDVHEVVDGDHRECPEGRCFVGEARFPLDHVHAGVALSDLLGHAGDVFALLGSDHRLARMVPERTVFLDVETTGLAGGTGTYAFLIGLGYFADGVFRIDQFFMRDPGEERVTLANLARVLGRFEAVVTFNGKCFDWPLIETRHLYNRVPLRPAAPLHLDLLFPARRLFRRRLGSCSLDALELNLFEMGQRVSDVPGWLIPTIYFDYLRHRDGRPLASVFGHNRQDILTMVALAVTMARHVADPVGAPPGHPVDLYSLGRLLEDAGTLDQAVHCYERALAAPPARANGRQPMSPAPLDRAEVLARLAGTYKRLRDADRAVALWEALVAEEAGSIYPYVELAKHLEHRARDFARAAEVTRQAIARHVEMPGLTSSTRYRSDRVDLEKRLSRLERKVVRATA